MRKRFTKIICSALAAGCVATAFALPACATKWSGVEMDPSAATVTSNGGFVVQTGDYVYFINGVTTNKDENTFGSVVKGSLQRISKTDLAAHNYSSTQTVVPSVLYAGNYSAGIYIYGDYVYYTTPSTTKNIDGETQNTMLDFKRTKLDGTDTTAKSIFTCENNGVDYRYVKVGDEVYIMYALTESSKTNIHSVKCSTGENKILAYGVDKYSFDTEDPENPYVYYTMSVYQDIGDGNSKMDYNQLYRVRADVAESPREYDFSSVKDYDADKDPVYINYGTHVFDGIGNVAYSKWGLNQFNYKNGDATYNLINSDYTYGIQWYKNGTLYYTRKAGQTNTSNLYTVTDGEIDSAASWDAINLNKEQTPFLVGENTTEYTFVNMDGKLWAISSASGIVKQPVEDQKLGDEIKMSSDASVTVVDVKEEGGHVNLYYTVSDGVYRLAVDGSYDDYKKFPVDEDAELEYSSIKILDLYAKASWYKPEFVGNTLLFASEIDKMSKYSYVMACDLTGADGIMSNKEIKAQNELLNGVMDKINAYDEEKDSDGEAYYLHLSNALKYLFYTRDGGYAEELNKAYTDIKGEDEFFAYKEQSVKVYKEYAEVSGDWAKDADGNAYPTKTVNGEEVAAIFSDYYYSVVGKLSEKDAEALKTDYKEYMEKYPEDTSTWWEKLSTGGKVGFIIGMVACGLLVIGAAALCTVILIKRKKNGILGESDEKSAKVDITDDRDMNVYGDEEN